MLRLLKIYRFLMMLILVNALLSQTFPKTLVLMDYYFHTSVYAAYCINKDKPEMHCDGTCQLDKAMNDMDHHGDSSRLVEISFSNYLPPQTFFVKTPERLFVTSPPIFHPLNPIPEDWFEKPLQPPQFSV